VNPAQQILAICGNYDSVVYGRALSLIAWDKATEEQKNDSLTFGSWEEAPEGTYRWPETTGSDWCGEFKEKVEAVVRHFGEVPL
jgi:hypothetical protein